MSTQFNGNEGNIELLLRTVISVNQLSIFGVIANLCTELNESSVEDSSEDSKSSGNKDQMRWTFYAENVQCLEMQDAHLTETQQSMRPIRPEHQQRQRQDLEFEGGENFDYHVDRKTGWRHCREPRGNTAAASPSSTSQWQNFTMANELELMAAHIIREMVVISVSWKEFQKIDGSV